jgi:hypothetical protein
MGELLKQFDARRHHRGPESSISRIRPMMSAALVAHRRLRRIQAAERMHAALGKLRPCEQL